MTVEGFLHQLHIAEILEQRPNVNDNMILLHDLHPERIVGNRSNVCYAIGGVSFEEDA